MSFEVDAEYFRDKCRICFRQGKLYSLFENELASIFMDLTQIEIFPYSPHRACVSCLKELCNSYNFVAKCKKMDIFIKNSTNSETDQENCEIEIILPPTVNFNLVNEENVISTTTAETVNESDKENKPPEEDNTCKLCNKKLARFYSLKKHMLRIHNVKLEIKCPYCEEAFDNKTKLMSHRLNFHTRIEILSISKAYEAQPPQRSSGASSNCESESPIENINPYHTATSADAVSALKPNSVVEHSLLPSSEFNATVCDPNPLANVVLLSTNNEVFYPNENSGYTWEQTVTSQSSGNTLQLPGPSESTQGSTKTIELPPKSKPQLLCEYCGALARGKRHLATHVKQINNKICYKCNLSFKKLKRLTEHIRTIHGDEVKYECKECDKKFAYFSVFMRHRSFHEKRKLKCAFCTKKFVFDEERMEHQKLHIDGTLPVVESTKFCYKCSQYFEKDIDYLIHCTTCEQNEKENQEMQNECLVDENLDLIKTNEQSTKQNILTKDLNKNTEMDIGGIELNWTEQQDLLLTEVLSEMEGSQCGTLEEMEINEREVLAVFDQIDDPEETESM